MSSNPVIRSWVAAAAAAAVVLAGGCATQSPRLEAYKAPPVGSTWTISQVNTGSYGAGTARITVTPGERVWQGRQVITFRSQAGTTLADPATGRWIAVLTPNEAVALTWEPPLGYEFPIEEGKTWVSRHRVDNRLTGRAVDFEAIWRVEAYEDVTVPAGTFKAHRIRYSDTMGNEDLYWSSPDTGGFVKTSQKRSARHAQGAGTRETELVSQTLRP